MNQLDRVYDAIIVDDDTQNIVILEHILNEYFGTEVNVKETFKSAYNALKYINSDEIDIVFLDIEMPELNGFDLIKSISDQSNAKIVLVSSHDEYAFKAFKHSVFDFLKKPVLISDMRDTISKLRKSDSNRSGASELNINDNRLVVNRQDKTIFIDINQILRMEACGSYTDIYLEDGSKVNSSKKIHYYEEMLGKYPFYKLHRSHIVNINKIKEIIKNEGEGMVVMQDGSRIEISRAKKDEFLRMMIKEKK